MRFTANALRLSRGKSMNDFQSLPQIFDLETYSGFLSKYLYDSTKQTVKSESVQNFYTKDWIWSSLMYGGLPYLTFCYFDNPDPFQDVPDKKIASMISLSITKKQEQLSIIKKYYPSFYQGLHDNARKFGDYALLNKLETA